MKKRKLKPVVKNTLIVSFLFVLLLTSLFAVKGNKKSVSAFKKNYVYVNDYIFDNYYPVLNNEEKIIKPFTKDNVSILRNFYDKEASEEEQQKSIIYHEGIYMQNSGVDYSSPEEFDVISILSGTVSNIINDSLLGKTIEVKVSNEITVMYQSVKDITVKKGDNISQGDIIAKSGTCSINKDVENGLHIEIYNNGVVINPSNYYDKSIKDILNG